VVAEVAFEDRHVGAPGIAHGGAVATVFDDLFGFLLYAVAELAVTRSLQVEYRSPVLLRVAYSFRARVDRREGRRLHLSATATSPDGALVAASTALFLTVGIDHFLRSASSASTDNQPG
jgi:acyl-coenzyme A thioesterase PaaI-like protein